MNLTVDHDVVTHESFILIKSNNETLTRKVFRRDFSIYFKVQ